MADYPKYSLKFKGEAVELTPEEQAKGQADVRGTHQLRLRNAQGLKLFVHVTQNAPDAGAPDLNIVIDTNPPTDTE